MNQEIIFSIEAGVGHIYLNRPDKFNSFNRTMALQLIEAINECDKNDNIRAVYLSGMGKAFCAGQDLAEVIDPNGPGMEKILKEHFNPIVTAIKNCSKPIVAAVNGVAAGAGANIALCCDIVIATAQASFIQAFSKIGLIPDSGGTYTLPRLIGWQKASALMLLGDKVSAIDALQMGMIYKIFEEADFKTSSIAIATQLAQMPTKALTLTKLALQKSALNSFEQQLETEDELQQQASQTIDFKEGIAAFLEKRNPVFKGN
jgi:2-(1,2-epoxy-1,2-dihydrophenyl)acetyl-CoA isomerase